MLLIHVGPHMSIGWWSKSLRTNGHWMLHSLTKFSRDVVLGTLVQLGYKFSVLVLVLVLVGDVLVVLAMV